MRFGEVWLGEDDRGFDLFELGKGEQLVEGYRTRRRVGEGGYGDQ